MRRTATFSLFICVAIWFPQANGSAQETLSQEKIDFFETKIRPVLVKECYGCHSNQTGNAKGGLRLDTQELTAIGGNSGPAVVPGDLDESLLYSAILHQDFQMPPKRKLSQSVINDFRSWIEMGAPDPRITAPSVLKTQITKDDIQQAKTEFWAYKKPTQAAIPAVQNREWSRSDLDPFVLAKLEASSMTPAVDAEPHQILRRLCFDLIGLPPSLAQIEYFEKYYDTDPDKAIAHVVDQLLEKPQFGERWGRHWLDLVRYAESNGREVNTTFPHAWRYRDYVIDSFNEDKPYDRFLQEQIAGDLLPVDSDSQWAENLVATGFLAIGPKSLAEQNRTQFTADLVDEQIDTTTRAILGMSVACARCHDHKFDPIPQTDYYALAGIFNNTTVYFGTPASKYGNIAGVQNRNSSNLLRLPIDDPNEFDRRIPVDELADLNRELDETLQQLVEYRRNRRQNDGNAANAIQNFIRLQTRAETLSTIIGGVDEQGNPITYCMGVQETDDPRDVRVLVRGEVAQPAQMVPRGFPSVLREDNTPKISPRSSGRLELAQWISSRDNPLTARVMVNRIWQHLIGQGIVRSTENFGTTGQAPTHPELLDTLAVKFVDSGWSIKSMVREIATSRVYRMSTQFDQASFESDPDNELLWRATPRRLDAEAIRDAILFASGNLQLDRPRASEVAKAGYMRVRDGNLFNPAQFMSSSEMGMEMMSGGPMNRERLLRSRPELQQMIFRQALANRRSGGERLDMNDATFRSAYLPIVRGEEPRVLEVFDFAEPSMIVGQRETSSTPNQSLFMMNNPFVMQQSDALAERVLSSSQNPEEQIRYLFRSLYSREPDDSEISTILAFADDFPVAGLAKTRATKTVSAICQSLIASAEFRYLD
ncbi:PSD1 and planctomycete cytochrome C domain-containing protein [Novipirellula rosea]|uniref:PSD1 and planctomycete cytochrome C domain-containing protein n=1 Tax=Novipirellula rosea TaxID=1031540 RepID=A0ABP8N856_9BACT